MTKFVPDDTIDVLLDKVATATKMDAVSDVSTPTNLTNSLASVSMTPGTSGDFTIAAGDVSGRKVTVAQKASVSISTSGTARHIVLTDTSGGSDTIVDITTCTDQVLSTGGGGTVTFPSWSHEVLDPT